MEHENNQFSLSEAAVWLLSIVLAIQVGWLAYSLGRSVAAQPYRNMPAAAAGATAGASMSAADEGNTVANGPELYAANCASCHGANAEGAVGPNLAAAGKWTLAEFTEATLHGKTPDGRELAPIMPHFADTGLGGAPATDQQLEAIHNFLSGL